ncbi:MAG: 30S ribosomal protein S17 [Myxococcales bacterium]|nr:30S ribosomal protein S17 [Myxococcales bacterium]
MATTKKSEPKAPKSAPKASKSEPKAEKAAKVKAAPEAPQAPAADAAAAPAATERAHSFRRKLVGTVTSDKMHKTVTVEVQRRYPDPVYKKYVRTRERYKAHDEKNEYRVGDRVEIQEHRPISRTKRWAVTRLVVRALEHTEAEA